MKKVYFSLVGDPQTVIDIGNLGISVLDYLQCITDDYNYKWKLAHPDKYPDPGPLHPKKLTVECPSDKIRIPASQPVNGDSGQDDGK